MDTILSVSTFISCSCVDTLIVPVLNVDEPQFAGNNLGYDDVKSYWRHLLIEYTKLLDWDVVKHPSTQLITADKHRVVDKN
jgi:hypothetical protein